MSDCGDSKKIEELENKLKILEVSLDKNIYKNPLKEMQLKYLNDLKEFKVIYKKNLSELSEKLNSSEFKLASKAKEPKDNTAQEIANLTTELEHKKYQVKILKDAFLGYEKTAEEKINTLEKENAKLKYRISILLNVINEQEDKLKNTK